MTRPSPRPLLLLALAAALTLWDRPCPAQDAAPAAAPEQSFEQRWRAAAGAITAKLRSAPRQAACADSGLARALLAVEKAALLHQSRSAFGATSGAPGAAAELGLAEAWVKSPCPAEPADWRGFHELAFISPLDLSAQPCLLYVPTKHDGKTPLPLLIFLHGYAGDLNKANWRDYMYSPSLQAVCEELGYALLLPFARGNTEFMGVGEEDVLYALNFVKQRIPVDESRVVMSGASMGGSGAYSIACHYPHLFSGVFTVTGRVDYYLWMKKDRSHFPPFKQFWLDNDYARELLGNLLHVPVFIGHGDADHLLNVDQSRLMARLLQELKQDVKYVEFPGESHYIWSKTFEQPELKERLARWKRPAAPARVQFKTYTLKHNRAYWVQISAITAWGTPASVDARVASRHRIEIAAANVATLILTPANDLVDLAKPVEIVVNGAATQVAPAKDGSLSVVLSPAACADDIVVKTPSLCGPARQAFEAPFIIVAPTQKAPALESDVRLTQQVAVDWYRYAQGAPVVRRDTEITPADIAECNLILCGSPDTNAVYQRIADKLPIQLTGADYVLGDRRFPRQGAGMVLLYPNPLNPQRAVLICQGLPWGKSLSTNHKYDFLPDFVIFTEEVDRDGTMFETNRALCAGYFDSAWRLNPSTTW